MIPGAVQLLPELLSTSRSRDVPQRGQGGLWPRTQFHGGVVLRYIGLLTILCCRGALIWFCSRLIVCWQFCLMRCRVGLGPVCRVAKVYLALLRPATDRG